MSDAHPSPLYQVGDRVRVKKELDAEAALMLARQHDPTSDGWPGWNDSMTEITRREEAYTVRLAEKSIAHGYYYRFHEVPFAWLEAWLESPRASTTLDASPHNDTCPLCGQPGYNGFVSFECNGHGCRNFKAAAHIEADDDLPF
jgi:hypothetical protein